MSLISSVILYGSMVGAVYIARILYEDNSITVGEVTSFMYYMLQLVFNFMILSFVFANVASIVGASDKICDLMQYQPAILSRGGNTISGEINGELELRNVKFHYPGKPETPILRGVSLKVDN